MPEPETPHTWFRRGGPTPPADPYLPSLKPRDPTDARLAEDARLIERRLDVKFLGRNPRTTAAGLLFVVLPVLRTFLESVGLSISDELWGNLVSLVAGLGFFVAHDAAKPAAAAPSSALPATPADPPTPGPVRVADIHEGA